MSPSRKTKNFVIVLIILNIFSFAIYWFISKEVRKNIEEVSNLASELDFQLNKEKQLKVFRDVAENTKKEREKLDFFFVPSEDIVSFIREVEDLAQLSGLSLEIGSVEIVDYIIDDKTSKTLEALSLNLRIEGDWQGSFYFLNLLEAMPYKISVERFSLGANKNIEGVTDNWEGIISVRVLKIK